MLEISEDGGEGGQFQGVELAAISRLYLSRYT